MNSRTLDFAEEILALTDGQGVDVVLNSLSGAFISKSLLALRETGRFLEIGKRDVWTAEQVKQLKPGVSYLPIDLLTVAQQQPDRVQSMLRQLMQQFQEGKLQPLPATVFPIQQVTAAFRTMQQAKHVGKIVVSQLSSTTSSQESRSAISQSETIDRFQVREDGTYLITGGLGGLGLLTADWLIQQGAKHLVLVSRHSADPDVQKRLQALEQAGVQVVVMPADVSQRSQLVHILDTIEQSLPPLRGVIHAAGVLDDGMLLQLNWQRLATVMAPKVLGAWNLHSLTQDKTLDFFVLFSSAASLLGSPGQANHVAANTFLDTLAHYRQSLGLPGLSINWGPWSEVGAAAQRGVDEVMRLRGIGTIAPQQGLRILEQLLITSPAQVGVIPINWTQFLQQGVTSPFFSAFLQSSPPKSPLLSQLEQASEGNRLALLTTHLQVEISKVLGLSPPRLPDPKQGFFDMGMDSLMMVELRNRLETSLDLSIASTLIFEYPTIQDLAQCIMTKISIPEATIAATTIEQYQEQNTETFEELFQNDIDTSIAKELEELETLLKRN